MAKCKKEKKAPKGYHFLECGLDYVFLINGYKIDNDPDFGEIITIYNPDILHREIARNVLLYKLSLDGQEVRFLRSLLRLTQQQLANKLDVTRETVVRWETGKTKVPSSVDGLLRIIVWEQYLDEKKAVSFFEAHKHDRTHYEALEMQETKNHWKSQIAA